MARDLQPVPNVEPDEIDLDALQRKFSVEKLRKARDRDFLSLADMPLDHGLGVEFDRVIGGGLAPGDIIGLGAPGTGAGKTAFGLQIVDGLALRSVAVAQGRAEGPLVFAVIVSELSAEALDCRSLGRAANVSPRILMAGRTAERLFATREEVDEAFAKAEALIEEGPFAALSEWQYLMHPPDNRLDLIPQLIVVVNAARARLGQKYGRDIQAVVFLDPVQRWNDPDKPETDALSQLAEDLDAAANREGWIVLVTSDTNKSSATAESGPHRRAPEDNLLGVFRGSMKLLHVADQLWVLDGGERVADASRPRRATITVVKNRRGPAYVSVRFNWYAGRGVGFYPVKTETEPMAREPDWPDGALIRSMYTTIEKYLPMRPDITATWLRDNHRDEIRDERGRECARNNKHGVEALATWMVENRFLKARKKGARMVCLNLGLDPRKTVEELRRATPGDEVEEHM